MRLPRFAILSDAQADILRDFDLISDFNEWPVKIGIIFTGSFHPYIEAGSKANVHSAW